jgi:hypothetical protein
MKEVERKELQNEKYDLQEIQMGRTKVNCAKLKKLNDSLNTESSHHCSGLTETAAKVSLQQWT